VTRRKNRSSKIRIYITSKRKKNRKKEQIETRKENKKNKQVCKLMEDHSSSNKNILRDKREQNKKN
jgi:hypothetical protein